MNWVTNIPRSVKGLWPRRSGVEYVEGPPQATLEYSVEQLRRRKIVGAYVAIPLDEYYRLPIIKHLDNVPEKS